MSAANDKPKRIARGVDGWTLAGTALVAVIVVLVNYISARRYERWDLTRDQVFTLSERTLGVIRELPQPVELYVFMSSGEQAFADLKELVDRYRAKTDKISVQYVDPDREAAKFKLLAEKYGVRAAMQEGGHTEAELALLAVSGERRWSVTRDDLVDVDFADGPDTGDAKTPKVNVKTEQALSGALVQVTSGRATKVCASEGHGEWSLTDSSERSLAALKEELKRDNVTIEALATRGKSTLPKECDAIFVLGPQKAFSSDEGDALERYLAAGGNVLLALDPVIVDEAIAPTGFEAFAAQHGIRIDAAMLVERDRERLLSPSMIEAMLIESYGTHPAVKALAPLGVPLVTRLARTLGTTGDQAKSVEVLFSPSEQAYGEAQLAQVTAGDDLTPGAGDVPSPVQVALGTPPRKRGDTTQPGGRLIVIGDSDWMQPELLHQPQLANVDLLSGVTGFLTEREALVSIKPRKIDAQALLITEDGLAGVFWRVVLLMPLAALVLGVGVYWQRRQ
ncbi:MAG: GldG family protein [Polyangiales bacterium]